MANETILINDVVKELNTFLAHNPKILSASLNADKITLDQHTKPLTKIKGKFPSTHSLLTDVVQGFSDEWTELGKLQIEHKILTDYHQKVNFPFKPSEVLHSYYAEMYDENKKKEDMPISKYVFDKELMPKVKDNLETLSIDGVYDAARLDEFGFSMNGILEILRAMTDRANAPKHPAFEIPMNAVTDANIIDEVTQFERKIPTKLKKKIKKIFMFENNAERYQIAYEDQFGQNKFQNDKMKTRLGKREIVVLPGDSDLIFGTTENNFRRLLDVIDEPKVTDIQKQDYKIKIFMEWWKGYDFLINQMVVVSNFTDVRHGLGSTEANQKYFGFNGVNEPAA
jgi:hypothetical protein